jgi:hypothetical protein
MLDIVGEFEFFRPPEYCLINNSKGHLLNAWNYLETFAKRLKDRFANYNK